MPYYLYLALRAKSLTYVTAVNPGFYLGGLFGESKRDILDLIPTQFLPSTCYFKGDCTKEDIIESCKAKNISFPFIIKPDVGERGMGVEKINSPQELEQYLANFKEPFLVQEFITFNHEFGVFYFKMPNGGPSGVTSITGKEFLSVKGDGLSTLQSLVKRSLRASYQYDRLAVKFYDIWNAPVPLGQEIVLENIGNHSRGTKFLDFNHLISKEVCATFDKVCSNITGFYFGRFDLKAENLDSLSSGNGLKIMELNGASSEPAHVYDPKNNIFSAYRDVFYHMKLANDIAIENYILGEKRVPFSFVAKQLFKHFS